jgi:nitrite reductase/ring-hydroxylating ferredoxin subunit
MANIDKPFTVGELRSSEFRSWIAALYAEMPQYLATTRAMRSAGSSYVSAATGDAHVLFYDGEHHACYVNSCAHLGLQIRPVGKTFRGIAYPRAREDERPDVILCPWHARKHDAKTGALLHLKSGETSCKKLRSVPTVRRGDLIFTQGNGALPSFAKLRESPKFRALGIDPLLIPSDFHLHKTVIYDEKMDAATGAANFEEDAHVAPTHFTTFAHVYDMSTLEVEPYGLASAAQFVGWQTRKTPNPSERYKKLRSLILQRTEGKSPPFGVIWYRLGPFTTMEQFALGSDISDRIIVVSSFVPKPDGIGSRNVVEFHVPNSLAHVHPMLIDAFYDAYDETAEEDRELCLAAEDGYDARIAQGDDREPVIPADTDEEACLINYYRYLRALQTYWRAPIDERLVE